MEKEPPHVVTVTEYDDIAIDEGRRANRRAINLYTRCRGTDTWPTYADTSTTLSLPPWAMRDADRTQADNLIAQLEGLTA